MYNELDYGSWAGEFQAHGEATYSSTEKAFVGTDYYSEEQSENFPTDIKVKIPKHLWFKDLQIHVEADRGSNCEAEVAFTISNGFLTQDHAGVQADLIQEIEQGVNEAIQKFEEKTGEESAGIWDDIIIMPNDDHKEEGEYNVYSIESIDIKYDNVDDKEIVLDLKGLKLLDKIKD